MNERACGLNQSLIKPRQLEILFCQPQLLEHVMRLVVALRIPKLKENAIVIGNSHLGRRGFVEGAHEIGNPLAFSHARRIILSEEKQWAIG